MIAFIKTRDKDNQFDKTSVKITSLAGSLEEVLEDFQDFLKACGYHFDGNVTIEYKEEEVNLE